MQPGRLSLVGLGKRLLHGRRHGSPETGPAGQPTQRHATTRVRTTSEAPSTSGDSATAQAAAPTASTSPAVAQAGPPHQEAQQEASQDAEARAAIASLTEQLAQVGEDASHTDQRVALLNELGAACAELGETEEAIAHYEASMALREQFGPAYNGLLTLYNDMLRRAAARRDGDGVQQWTSRLDGLTALSKRVMRSQY